MIKTSTLYLLVTLLAISLLTFGLMSGCDEKQIKSPVIGPAAGSGPVGGGDAQKIRLTANPSETITALADAQATVQITAIVENNIGQPMPDGTVVYWTATNGALDSVTTTTTNGASTVTLTFPKDFTGSSVVTAVAGDATASITINVVSVTPTPTVTSTPTPLTGFVVSAAQTTIAHQGKTTITAYVTTNGEPEPNVQVNFSVSGAGIIQESAAITDETGKATITLIGNNTSTNDQTATVTATTADGRSGSVAVIVTGGATPTPEPTATAIATATPSKTFVVTADSDPIGCNDRIGIQATALNNGQGVPGLQVTFKILNGPITFDGSDTDPTDTNGQAEVFIEGDGTDCDGSGDVYQTTINATTTDGRSGSVTIEVNDNP